ncbi:hypothetical protein OIU34_05830 [Pararhizobium sp. BT-229]|uniref:hypothetical protein n=1 Tax=Pararhizobium sp. BT-229 TaxID=2986923 RepID=UPI0021F717E2|nr:hypothetical protein [Pararhizobium sp. BT-229]MCV9961415.1 hypothetical protein [Pararhizobium sp. BT-229]
MSKFWFILLVNLCAMLANGAASACAMRVEIDLHDVEYADVVVVGRIANYEVVLDPVARQRHKEILARFPDMPEALRNVSGFMSDYARFDVLVDEVLRGTAPKTLSVTWDNSTFREPEHMPTGSFLIALRSASSQMPPLRWPSATILPTPDTDALTVLQAPCAIPFLFENASNEAGLVRQILVSNSK